MGVTFITMAGENEAEREKPYAELWHAAGQEIPPLSARLLSM